MITHSLPLAFLLTNPDGSPMSPMDLFAAGHEIMWPILLLSFVAITVIVERLLFIFRENGSREPEVVQKMLESVEHRDIEGAVALGKKSNDFVARILVYSLTNKEFSLTNAFVRASSQELARFTQGMATLDTCITAAPLLGLLGTVTGMMRTFGASVAAISVRRPTRSPAVWRKRSLPPCAVCSSPSPACSLITT
jgi:biopolymer transport protein ExbB